MLYQIDPSTKLELNETKVILTIRNSPFPFRELTLLLVIMASSIGILYALFRIGTGFMILIGCVCGILILMFLIMKILIECNEIDLVNKVLVRKNKIGNIVIQTHKTSWRKGSRFKYQIHYDSYENIKEIQVIVYHPDRGNAKVLVRFFDKKTFHEFRKIFNNNFPENKIMEWHD